MHTIRKLSLDEYTSTDADHGRVETRCTRVCTAPKDLDDTHRWPSLKAFVHAIPTRELNGKSRQSERVCLMANCPSAREAAAMIRGHWQIENNLHWSLDVILNDDQHRARKDNAPINFAAPGRIALNIMKANTDKGSNRVKFKRAGWKDDFLRTLESVDNHRAALSIAQRCRLAAQLVSILSYRVAIPLNSLILAKQFSIRLRHLYM